MIRYPRGGKITSATPRRFNGLGFVFLIMTAVFTFSMCAVAQSTNEPFLKGEVIHYDIKKFKLKVGEATLAYNGAVEVQGRAALSITFTAHGFKFLDEEMIYIDAQTFYPILIKRNLSMFGKEERIVEFYNSQKGKVRIVKTVKGKTTEQVLESGGPFDNIYGFIYRHRKLRQSDQNKALNLHLPTRDLQFELAQQGTFSIEDREFNVDHMVSIPKKYEIWFDNGPKRIPLKIDGALGFGSMSMVYRDRRVEGE